MMSTLRVTVQYLIRRTQTRQTAEFARGGLGDDLFLLRSIPAQPTRRQRF